MIPLSDIQRTSVRGTALCLEISAADSVGMCFKGNQDKAELLAIKLLFIEKPKMETQKILPLTCYLADTRSMHSKYIIYPSQILYVACQLHKIKMTENG